MSTKFKIGDRLRVREWDDMANEFGQNEYSDTIFNGFTDSMRHLCGKEFTVRKIYHGRYYSVEGIEKKPCGNGVVWSINGGMLERLREREINPASDADFLLLFNL